MTTTIYAIFLCLGANCYPTGAGDYPTLAACESVASQLQRPGKDAVCMKRTVPVASPWTPAR
jgi:hypothetical protein